MGLLPLHDSAVLEVSAALLQLLPSDACLPIACDPAEFQQSLVSYRCFSVRHVGVVAA